MKLYKKVFSYVVLCLAIFAVGVAAVTYLPDLVTNQEELIENQEPMVEQEASEPEYLGAALVYVDGQVEYQQAQEEWSAVEQTITLAQGDKVRTGDDSKAIINFDDGSAVRLDANSTVTLSSLVFGDVVISNDAGQVYARVESSELNFSIVSDDSSYHALGTAYKVVNTEEKLGVEVFCHQVKVKQNNKEKVVVDQGKKYYLKNEKEKDNQEKLLDLDVEELEKESFTAWNKELDEKQYEDLGVWQEAKEDQGTKQEEKDEQTVKNGLSLSAQKTANGIKFSWTVKNVDITKGFKIVKSTKANPVYPGSAYVYLSSNEQRSYNWEITDGQTYHFRVCQYLGGACGVYSNDVTVTASKIEEEKTSDSVSSISLTHVGNGTVSWIANGNSPKGFKLVWSKNYSPTYPLRSGDKYEYYSSPSATAGTITSFDGSGKYYVRVCEYLGGECGVYSNQISVTLEDEKQEVEEPQAQAVNSISVSDNGAGRVSWSIDGYSEKGYKVVWSKNSSPTYPCRSGDKYQYFSNPETSSAKLTTFDGAGTYYVRVCEYLGGKCGVYSNQIQIDLE